jgi:PST family polysaccharide transporter
MSDLERSALGPAESPENLRGSAVRGLAWTLLRSLSSRLAGAIVFVMLARVLDPEAFGTVAIASVFVVLISLLVESGFAEALIQRKEVTRADLDTAFWLCNSLGVALSLITIASAGFISALFHQPDLAAVLRVLSLMLVLAGLVSVPQAVLRRELAFRAIALRGLAATLAGGVVGVGMALGGFGVWSLAGQLLANAVVGTVVVWLACSWRPSREVSRSSFIQLFRFGRNILGERLTLFASRRADDFLVGLVLGAAALGLYTAAYRILLVISEFIIWTIESVAFPFFSRLHAHAERIKRAFYTVTELSFATAVPAFLTLTLIAPELIRVAFGSQWDGAIRVLQVLAFVGIPHSLVHVNKAVLNAAGRTDLSLRVAILTGLVNVVGFVVVVRWGIVAVAASYVVCSYVLTPVSVWYVTRVLDLRVAAYVRLLAAPVVSGLAMLVIGAAFRSILPDGISAVAEMAVLSSIAITAYLLVLCLTGRALVKRAISNIRRALAQG